MFDYVNKLQLALGDKARRTGLKIGAGVVGLIATGFLLAALWGWLAYQMDLGPTMASLIIGGAFLLIALILFGMSKSERHSMPSTDELKSEVEARLSLATDTALDKAKGKAEDTMDSAQARVSSLFSAVEDKARGLVDHTEARVQNVASSFTGVASSTARKAGLTRDNIDAAKETLDRATDSRAAPGVGLVGAFAVGMAIAGALKGRGGRDRDDEYYRDRYDRHRYDRDDDWYRGA